MDFEAGSISTEIERRFLVPIEQAMRHTSKAAAYIEQCYLTDSGDWQVRSRMKLSDGKKSYFLTMKKAISHGKCIEIEQPGSCHTHAQIHLSSGALLKKTRSIHALSRGHFLELDIFDDKTLIPGFAIAEVEVASLEEDVALPSWLGREITGEKSYSNRSLYDQLLQR